MWFNKPKTKTYTVNAPKFMGYTTDLTMTLPLGLDAPFGQISYWLDHYERKLEAAYTQSDVQVNCINKQAAEITHLQEAVKRYATEATEIRDELDAKTKKYESSYAALGDLYISSTDRNFVLRKDLEGALEANGELCAELEETEDAYCELYEAYEELVEAAEAKPAKKPGKKSKK